MDTSTTVIYTLSLHDALPIYQLAVTPADINGLIEDTLRLVRHTFTEQKIDRKSTRLNSSHSQISYAVFCLKKKRDDSLVIARQIFLETLEQDLARVGRLCVRI